LQALEPLREQTADIIGVQQSRNGDYLPRNAYKDLVGKLKKKDHLKDLVVSDRILLK
jgi:hypothetical protein